MLTLVSFLCQRNKSLRDDLFLLTNCLNIPSENLVISILSVWQFLPENAVFLAIVEENMLAIWNSFMGWNLNLNKKMAAAQLAPQILQ